MKVYLLFFLTIMLIFPVVQPECLPVLGCMRFQCSVGLTSLPLDAAHANSNKERLIERLLCQKHQK